MLLENGASEGKINLVQGSIRVACASNGGPAAAKVVKRDIHPIKLPDNPAASDCMAELSRILNHKAPPWLAKVMGADVDARVRFEREATEA